MNFEDWLKTKGCMDGYGTDYQDAYDEGFDEGVLYQEGEVDKLQAKIDELQNKVIDQQNAFDKLYESLQEIQTMTHKSISFEHDLYDKGWNHSSRQLVINIHRLTGIGGNLLK